jgi:hypothetical protein
MIPFFSSDMNIPIQVFDVHEIANCRRKPSGAGDDHEKLAMLEY